MCGIGGVLKISDNKINLSELDKAIKFLKHRGPDDDGVWIADNKNIAFIHTRLSIVDLSKSGSQPMISHNARYCITYNGEIYNHLEIRKIIEKKINKKIPWKSSCDTETLLESISYFGLEFTLNLISGMFAFALWDNESEILYICRDKNGEKPIYYGWINENFYFFSELKPFFNLCNLKNKISRESLKLFLEFMYVPTPYSIFKNIYKLNPGHFLKIKNKHKKINNFNEIEKCNYADDGIQLFKWSSISKIINKEYQKKLILNKSIAVKEFKRLLTSSILEQTLSDRPIGVFLSGGIDSSLIASILQKHSKGKIKTFSIGFYEKKFDESVYSDDVAKHISSNHYNFKVTADDLLKIINEIHLIYDEPFGDSSQIPTVILCQKAKKIVDVVLTGDGADEFFAGYNRHLYCHNLFANYNFFINFFYRLYNFFYSKRIKIFNKFFIKVIKIIYFKDLQIKIKIDKILFRLKFLKNKLYFFKSFLYEIFEKSLVIGLDRNNSNKDFLDKNLSEINRKDYLSQILYIDQKNYLTDDILCKIDRASMHYGLETRAPYLNKELIKFSWKLDNSLKILKNKSKFIMRELLSEFVPKNIYDRSKMGFGIPLEEWLRGPLRQTTENTLNEKDLKNQNILDYDSVKILLEEHFSCKKNNSNKIWALLIFQKWFNNL